MATGYRARMVEPTAAAITPHPQAHRAGPAHGRRCLRAAATLALGMALCAAAAQAQTPPPGCAGSPALHQARPLAVQAWVRSTGLRVLTLAGYSGAGYQDPAAMRAAVEQALAARDPQQWLVAIGGTAVGIGEAYAWAKQRGFATLGIVSSLARAEQVPLSPCVDQVFYVPDTQWGGLLPDGRLSPTSQAMVDSGDAFLAIGGGEVTRDEMLAARRAGKPVQFVPADLDHALALHKARQKGLPAPSDFRGAAHAALAGTGR